MLLEDIAGVCQQRRIAGQRIMGFVGKAESCKGSLRLIEERGPPEGLGKVGIDLVIRQPDDRILEGRLER